MSTATETALHEINDSKASITLTSGRKEQSKGQVVPIKHHAPSKVEFGAEVYGIDLNNFTDADFDLIHDALHQHKLLVFKEQPAMLEPQQQYKLTSR